VDAFVAKVHAQRDAGMFVLDQLSADGPVAAALAAAAQKQGVHPIVYRDFERAAWRRRPAGSSRARPLAFRAAAICAGSLVSLASPPGRLEVVDRSGSPPRGTPFSQ